jgi:hypothetical protein
MKRFVIASALLLAFIVPAWALEAGTYFVGLDSTTHTCSVMTEMKAGMKMMGKYKTQAEAETAMHSMKECKG